MKNINYQILKILICIIMLFFPIKIFAQTQPVEIFPDGTFSECPGEYITYTAEVSSSYSNGGCQFEWTVTNGTFNNNSTTIYGNPVSVKWDNTAGIGKLSVEVYTCNVPVVNGTYPSDDITIKSIANVTPQAINGPSNVLVYAQSNINYSTSKINYPNTGGQGQPQAEEVDSYQWIIPLGWELDGVFSDGSTPITNQSNAVSVTPNNCGGDGDKIKVRAYSSCGPGYTSKWRELTINRTLPALSFSQAPPDFLICGDTGPITVSVAPISGASSYTWTKPSGWSGSSTSNSITLVPNGTTGGSISVKANVCGHQTSALSKTIILEQYNPSYPPFISGASYLCHIGSSYYVSNVPAGATVTWSSSPNITLLSAQGVNPATFKATSTENGPDSFIAASISTGCGTVNKKKDQIYTTPGLVSNPTIQGSSVVCNGGYWSAQRPIGADAILWDFDDNNMTLLSGGLNTSSITLEFKPGAYTGWVSVKTHSACGWTYPNYLGINKVCNYYSYSISPNPSTGTLKIYHTPVTDNAHDAIMRKAEKKLSSQPPKVQAELYDSKDGSLVARYRLDKEGLVIDTQKFKKGKYILHMLENGEIVLNEQMIFK